MLLCYITDRSQLPGDEAAQREQLLDAIYNAAHAGVDYIQLREKDLAAGELAKLAIAAIAQVQLARKIGSKTRLLINSRIDVAVGSGADGVHLRSDDIAASEARAIFSKAEGYRDLGDRDLGYRDLGVLIGVSCHSPQEVALAESHGADFAVFGPVFEKGGLAHSDGAARLRAACSRPAIAGSAMKVLALGGVTLANAAACMDAGADGIAGIRLFQSGDVAETVRTLRAIHGGKRVASHAFPYGKN